MLVEVKPEHTLRSAAHALNFQRLAIHAREIANVNLMITVHVTVAMLCC